MTARGNGPPYAWLDGEYPDWRPRFCSVCGAEMKVEGPLRISSYDTATGQELFAFNARCPNQRGGLWGWLASHDERSLFPRRSALEPGVPRSEYVTVGGEAGNRPPPPPPPDRG